MKRFLCKLFAALFVMLSVGAAFICSIPCSAAESNKHDQTPSQTLEFKITAPRIAAACCGVVLFTCAQVVVYLKTDKS